MRTDFYSMIHKALRGLLYGTAAKLTRSDFSDEAQAAEAVHAVRTLLAFLREHQDVEDRQLMPALLSASRDVAERLARQHVGGEELQREIDVLVARIDGAAPDARAALGVELDRKLAALVAHHLEHMNLEETAGHEALWASFTDEVLEEMQLRVRQSIAPERMREWMVLVAPTLTAAQRLAMGLEAA